jgi:hypothetical protein
MAFKGTIFPLLQGHDLSPQVTTIGGNEDPGFTVFDSLSERFHAEPPIHHGMDSPDLGRSEHGHDQLRDPRQVDGDPVALLHTHASEDVGELAHFPVQREETVAPQAPVFPFPDQSQLVSDGSGLVPVQGVQDDVGLSPGEPSEKGSIRVVQNLIPGLVPVQELLGPGIPKGRWVGGGLGPEGIIVGHVGGFDDLEGWAIDGLVLGHWASGGSPGGVKASCGLEEKVSGPSLADEGTTVQREPEEVDYSTTAIWRK